MKNFTIEFKWAAISIFTGLAWILLEKTLGLHDANIKWHPLFSMLIIFIIIPLYYLAIRDKKNNFYNGTITWKQGFICGLIITVIVTLFTPLTQYISLNVISPDYFKNAIAYTLSKSHMAQADAEAYFNLNSYIMQAVSMGLSFGVLCSGVISYLTKSK
ncbi:DUF4199 domain-containing protein [Flavobacterium enshiense]|uniref:DUF4199 domain-containing protein n=1 Tax=Flavobacterium enshiense TaxID=1341165 RepID=UPI00345DC610